MAAIKIALCQFPVRPTRSQTDMAAQLAEFGRRALDHRPDLVVFPEYVSFGLLAMAGDDWPEARRHQATREFVGPFTPLYEATFAGLARQGNCLVAGGSHWTPNERPGRGFNMAYLFHPDGRIDLQPKNHLYPNEALFGTDPFDQLRVFPTRFGPVGLMTCYEAEFPETARHLMIGGARILICPAATNTVRGFHRVRHCCAARAVENQVFVLECHAVGGLPVPVDKPFTVQGRSAVLAPIDDQTRLADGLVAEAASPDEAAVVVAEIDLEILELSRQRSEATILKDRRPEIYRTSYRLF